MSWPIIVAFVAYCMARAVLRFKGLHLRLGENFINVTYAREAVCRWSVLLRHPETLPHPIPHAHIPCDEGTTACHSYVRGAADK